MTEQPAAEAQSAPDVLQTPAAGPAAIRGGTARVLSYFVAVVLSAGAAALLFRHLGVNDTGTYVTTLSLVAIVAGVSDLGLTAVGIREASVRGPDARQGMLADLLGLRIALTAAGLAIMLVIAVLAYSPAVTAGVALAGLGLVLKATQDNLAIPLSTSLRLGAVAGLDLLYQAIGAALIALLAVAGAALVPFFAVPIPAGAAVLVATAAVVRGDRSLRPSFDWQRWRPLLARVGPYSAAVVAGALYFRVAIIVVSQLASAHELGLFGASFRVIEVLTAVPALLVGAALPIFAHAAQRDHERLGYALGRVFEVALIVGAWTAVSIAVGAPLAIAIVGGPQFAGAASILSVQGIALAGTFVSSVWAYGLLSLGMHREILVINVSALAASTLLMCVLVPLDGAHGAAIGIAIGEVAAAILSGAILIARHPGLRPSFGVVPRTALAAAVGVIPLALPVPVIVRLLLSTALFGAAIVATRALPPELRALLPGSA